jgi:hypothetical protein
MSIFGWDLPPGVRVQDLPGWSDPPLWPQLRCPFCNCWVSEKPENLIRQEIHESLTGRCPGDPDGDGLYLPDECYTKGKHGPHEITEYKGMTTWFRCKRCGADVPLDEY